MMASPSPSPSPAMEAVPASSDCPLSLSLSLSRSASGDMPPTSMSISGVDAAGSEAGGSAVEDGPGAGGGAEAGTRWTF